MSIYPKFTEQVLIELRKLAEEQKNQRALQIKNKTLKQTHDIELAKSFSPILKQSAEVIESTKNLGEVFKESQPKNYIPQAIEHTPLPQPKETNEGVVYDTERENTKTI